MNESWQDRADCSANLESHYLSVYIFLNIAFGTMSVGGNILIICAVLKTKALRTSSNYYILSLALTDLFTGALISPLYIGITVTKVWMEVHLLMKIENFMWIQSLTTSSYNLCAISIDRYWAICHAFHYRQIMTKKISLSIIGSIWVFSIVFASLTLFLQHQHVSFLWIACTFITVVIPLFIIVFCYCRIFKILNTQVRKISKSSVLNKENIENIKNRKGAWTIAIIILVFFILCSPNLVFAIIEIAARSTCEKLVVYKHWLWGILIGFSSSGVNPFIYAARNEEFRNAFRKLLCFKSNQWPLNDNSVLENTASYIGGRDER